MFASPTKTSFLSFQNIPRVSPKPSFLLHNPSAINDTMVIIQQIHRPLKSFSPHYHIMNIHIITSWTPTLSHHEHPQLLLVNVSNIFSIVNNYKHNFFTLYHYKHPSILSNTIMMIIVIFIIIIVISTNATQNWHYFCYLPINSIPHNPWQ